MKDLIELYKAYSGTAIKSRFQYSLDVLVLTFGVFFRESICIIAMIFTLNVFDNLNGWNMMEIMFLFSIISITYCFLVAFFMVFRDFPDWIKHGDFDRILLRPRGIFLQIFLNGADWVAALAHGLLGIILLIVSSVNIGLNWDIYKIMYLIITIISGTLIQGGIFVFFSSFAFHIREVAGLRHFIFWQSRKFATFPLSIYGNLIKSVFTFVFPFAFVNYFPVLYLIGKKELLQGNEYLFYIHPIIGVLMISLACAFWKYSLKFYKSSGN